MSFSRFCYLLAWSFRQRAVIPGPPLILSKNRLCISCLRLAILSAHLRSISPSSGYFIVMGGEPEEARQGGAIVSKNDANNTVLSHADVERALARFAEAAASNPKTPPRISSELESVLEEISATGVPYYAWGILKELLAARMVEVVGALEKESGFRQAGGGKAYAQRRDELMASLRGFDAAPFTLQRLAEVLKDPRRQYASTHKLINGLERLLVVSTTLPLRPRKGSATMTYTASSARTEAQGHEDNTSSATSSCASTSNCTAVTNGSTDRSHSSSGGAPRSAGLPTGSQANGGMGSGGGAAPRGQNAKDGNALGAGIIPEDSWPVDTQPVGRDKSDATSPETSDSHLMAPSRKRLKMHVPAGPPVVSD